MLAKLAFERRLQRVAENIIGRQKIPFRAEFFDQRVGDCVRQHRGRVAYAKHIPAALAAGDFVGVPAGHDLQLAFLSRHARHGQRYRRVDVAGDEIDLIFVDQPPGLFDAGHDLVGRIGNKQLRFAAQNAAAPIDLLDGELSAGDLRFSERRINPGDRLDHADFYRLFFASPDRKRRRDRTGGPREACLEHGPSSNQACAGRRCFRRCRLQVVGAEPDRMTAARGPRSAAFGHGGLSRGRRLVPKLAPLAAPIRLHLMSPYVAMGFGRIAPEYERLALLVLDRGLWCDCGPPSYNRFPSSQAIISRRPAN